MSVSLKKLLKKNIRLSLLFSLPAAVLVLLFWTGQQKWLAAAGVFYGCLLALISLYMICLQSSGFLYSSSRARTLAAGAWTGRYLMYAVLLFGGAFIGFPVISMLIGVIMSKLALFVYAKMDADVRKEQETEESRQKNGAEIPETAGSDAVPLTGSSEAEKASEHPGKDSGFQS